MATPANSYAIPQKYFAGSKSWAMLSSNKYPPDEQKKNSVPSLTERKEK